MKHVEMILALYVVLSALPAHRWCGAAGLNSTSSDSSISNAVTTSSDTTAASDDSALSPTTKSVSCDVTAVSRQRKTEHSNESQEEVELSSGCQKPVIPFNMALVNESDVYDISATIRWYCLNVTLCEVLEGNSTQTCCETGGLSGPMPSCIYKPLARCQPLNRLLASTMTFTSPVQDDPNACGSTVTYLCNSGYEIGELQFLSNTCIFPGQWVTQPFNTSCTKKQSFIGCMMFRVTSEQNQATAVTLKPNGELECRGYCQRVNFFYSALVNGSECLCTNSDSKELAAVSVDNTYCNATCLGQESQFCGGTTFNLSLSWTGAFYFTIGGCYSTDDALTLVNASDVLWRRDDRMTSVACRQQCLVQGHQYAALRGTLCVCFSQRHTAGNFSRIERVKNSLCSLSCAENPSATCGGYNATSVYNLAVRHEDPLDCLDLYKLGVRTHGTYKFGNETKTCYMADNTKCDNDWIGYKGQCYHFVAEEVDVLEAISNCSSMGAHLASMATLSDQEFFNLTAYVFQQINRTKSWLLGYCDPDMSRRFVWSDGSLSIFNTFVLEDPTPTDTSSVCALSTDRFLISVLSAKATPPRGFACKKIVEYPACVDISHRLAQQHLALSVQNMTVTLCRQVCRAISANMSAILNRNNCSCINETVRSSCAKDVPGKCDCPCTGNRYQLCGNAADGDIFSHYPPLTMCPSSWFFSNGHCLRPQPTLANFFQAREFCNRYGGHIFTNASTVTMSYLIHLMSFVRDFAGRMGGFLGLVDSLNSGIFRYVDGSILTNDSFIQRDGLGSQQCVAWTWSSTPPHWTTVDCSLYSSLGFVCEKSVRVEYTGAYSQRYLATKLLCLTETPTQGQERTISDSAQIVTATLADTDFRWSDEDMTVTACVQLCKGSDTNWAVINGTQCTCAQNISLSRLASATDKWSCGNFCPGDPFQFCGGGAAVVLARVDMYTEYASGCENLYKQGVRIHGKYYIKATQNDMPITVYCRFLDAGNNTTYPAGWIHLPILQNENVYHFHLGFTSVQEAEEFCWNKTGGYLLSLSDPVEEEFLRYTLGGLATLRSVDSWLIGYTSDAQLSRPGWVAPYLFTYKPGYDFRCSRSGPQNQTSWCCMSTWLNGSRLDFVFDTCSYDGIKGFICKANQNLLGCSMDLPPASDLFLTADPDMSVLLCKQACLAQNTTALVVAGENCYCTSFNMSGLPLDPQSCTSRCAGHAYQACGNQKYALWYSTGISTRFEIATSCEDILNNGVLLNLTYVLSDNTSASLRTDNCYYDCGPLSLTNAVTSNEADGTMYRSKIAVTCPEGWELDSRQENYTVCGRDGWSNTAFTCAELSGVGTCDSPKAANVQNAPAAYLTFGHGTTLTLLCITGWTTWSGNNVQFVTCDASQTWTPQPQNCDAPVSCKGQEFIDWQTTSASVLEGLTAQSQQTATVGATITLVCLHSDDAFSQDRKTMTSKCRSDGTWDPPLQNCTVRCPRLDVPYATIVVNTSDPYTANVTCYSGYQLATGNVSALAVCANRTWPALQCHVRTCDLGLLTALHKVNVTTLTSTEGQFLIRLDCEAGYLFPDRSQSKVYGCLGGLWYPEPANCSGIQCSPLLGATNGIFPTASQTYPAAASILCKDGWTFRNGNRSMEVTCQADGSWSPIPEYCFRKPFFTGCDRTFIDLTT